MGPKPTHFGLWQPLGDQTNTPNDSQTQSEGLKTFYLKKSLITPCASHLSFAATKVETVMGFSEGEGAAFAVVGQRVVSNLGGPK